MSLIVWYLSWVFAVLAYFVWRWLRWLDRDTVAIGASRPCATCKFYAPEEVYDCRNPKSRVLDDFRTGRMQFSNVVVMRGEGSMRRGGEVCGVEGDWWKPKEKEQ